MNIQAMIDDSKMAELAKLIGKYVDDFETSQFRKYMTEGVAYYNKNNTEIMRRQKLYYIRQGQTVEDPYKANHKLPSGYMKLLVKQKVNYSINNRIKIGSSDNIDIKAIEDALGNWKKGLKQAAYEASKKAAAYWQFYINQNQEFDYKLIPAEQCIAIPAPDDPDTIEYFIRFYQQQIYDAKSKPVTIKKVEFWTSDKVYYFIHQDGGWEFAPESIEPYNPKPHIKAVYRYGDKVSKEQEQSWGRPPFAVLYNNDEKQNDLYPVKEFIDIYDIVNSDFANNLDDFQDIYWILKNYNGQDLDEFLTEIKELKAIRTGDGGDARAETINIPTEARIKMLDNTEKLIYKFGMGVNPDDIEGNITNVRIKALYSNLDLKANDFEIELQDFMQQALYFLKKYFEIKNTGFDFDESKIYLVFDRSMIINEAEMLQVNAGQQGSISEKTRLEHHAWVQNADDELKRIEKEKPDIELDDPLEDDQGDEQ